MDEGVYYTIGKNDDFVIECDVDTSTILPHPGGHMYISLGIITAKINQKGGSFYMDGSSTAVAKVGSKFHMKLSLTEGGRYEVELDGRHCGQVVKPTRGKVKIIFGFRHDKHRCAKLSHAYVNGIKMQQGVSRQ